MSQETKLKHVNVNLMVTVIIKFSYHVKYQYTTKGWNTISLDLSLWSYYWREVWNARDIHPCWELLYIDIGHIDIWFQCETNL